MRATPLTWVLVGELSASPVQWWICRTYHTPHIHSLNFVRAQFNDGPFSLTNRLLIRILKELLLLYKESDAAEAQTYAEELIKLVVSDPTTYIFDDVLDLAPIKALEWSKIYSVSAWSYVGTGHVMSCDLLLICSC